MKIWKNPISISDQKWVELLKNPKITYDFNKKILKALYESDNHANICSEIVKMINDPNCRAHGAANSSIGKFGKRILEETGVQAPSFRDDGIPWGWNVPFLGWHDEEHRGHYYWQLRPQLAKAIRNHPYILQPSEKSLNLERNTIVSPATNQEFIDQKNVARHNQNKKLSLDELRRRARHSQKDVKKRENISSTFERNQDVVDYVKTVAKGICQLCEAPAPFRDKDGDPFLHVHHIIWLTRNGSDTIDNCVALCPNCHAKMHVLDKKDDSAKLIEIARRHSE
jgi:predicted HNH restriction endonuclease